MKNNRKSPLWVLLTAILLMINGCSTTPGLPAPLAPMLVTQSSTSYTGTVYAQWSGPGLPAVGPYVPMTAATAPYLTSEAGLPHPVASGYRALMTPVPAACQVGSQYTITFFTVDSNNTLWYADDTATIIQPPSEDGQKISYYSGF